MTTAPDVAARLILDQHERGHTIDKMQLQKLLYLVQGAHLVLFGEAAFVGAIRAYRQGPVVRGVEQTYGDSVEGRNPISEPIGGHPEALPESVVSTIGLVLDLFGTWTGPNLERHAKRAGSPWHHARGELPLSAPSDREITRESILGWFAREGLVPRGSLSGTERDLLERAVQGDATAISELL